MMNTCEPLTPGMDCYQYFQSLAVLTVVVVVGAMNMHLKRVSAAF